MDTKNTPALNAINFKDLAKQIGISNELGLGKSFIILFTLLQFFEVDKKDIKDFYVFFFAFLKDNIFNSLVILIGFILVFLLHRHIKEFKNNTTKDILELRRKQIAKSYEVSIGKEKLNEIKEVLNELLKRYKASRIWFFVYHNGGFTPTGVGKKKMSIVYEATNVGIIAIGTRFLDMDVNFFPDWIKTFVAKKDVIVKRLCDDIPEQWRFIAESSGYKSLYSSGLWTEEDMPYGFFGMGFQYETILEEQDLKFYFETQKKLNEILAQERCYANLL